MKTDNEIPTKRCIFIGSSVEGLDLAHAVQEVLQHNFYVTPWSQGVFKPSTTALNSLLSVLDESDYGIFVFTPDDIATIRDQKKKIVRDNVIFELGLFIGRLGVDSCFWITPSGNEDLHLPSDLLGVHPATYDATHPNITASVGPACSQIRRAIADNELIRKNRKIQSNHKIDTSEPISPSDKAATMFTILEKKTIRIGDEEVKFLDILVALSDELNKGFNTECLHYDWVFVDVWRALSKDKNDELIRKLRKIKRMLKDWANNKQLDKDIAEVQEKFEINTAHLLTPLIASGAVVLVNDREGTLHVHMSELGNEIVKRVIFISKS